MWSCYSDRKEILFSTHNRLKFQFLVKCKEKYNAQFIFDDDKEFLQDLIKMISLKINQLSLSLDFGQRTCEFFSVWCFSPEWCILTEKVYPQLRIFSQRTMTTKMNKKKIFLGWHLIPLKQSSNLLFQQILLIQSR